jgi:hypothetical protein
MSKRPSIYSRLPTRGALSSGALLHYTGSFSATWASRFLQVWWHL